MVDFVKIFFSVLMLCSLGTMGNCNSIEYLKQGQQSLPTLYVLAISDSNLQSLYKSAGKKGSLSFSNGQIYIKGFCNDCTVEMKNPNICSCTKKFCTDGSQKIQDALRRALRNPPSMKRIIENANRGLTFEIKEYTGTCFTLGKGTSEGPNNNVRTQNSSNPRVTGYARPTATAAPLYNPAPAAPVYNTAPAAPVYNTAPAVPVNNPAPVAPVYNTAPAAPVYNPAPAATVDNRAPAAPVYNQRQTAPKYQRYSAPVKAIAQNRAALSQDAPQQPYTPPPAQYTKPQQTYTPPPAQYTAPQTRYQSAPAPSLRVSQGYNYPGSQSGASGTSTPQPTTLRSPVGRNPAYQSRPSVNFGQTLGLAIPNFQGPGKFVSSKKWTNNNKMSGDNGFQGTHFGINVKHGSNYSQDQNTKGTYSSKTVIS